MIRLFLLHTSPSAQGKTHDTSSSPPVSQIPRNPSSFAVSHCAFFSLIRPKRPTFIILLKN